MDINYWDLSHETKAQIHYKINLNKDKVDIEIVNFIRTVLDAGINTRMLKLISKEAHIKTSDLIDKLIALKEMNKFNIIPRISRNRIHNFNSQESSDLEICPRIIVANSELNETEEIVLKRDQIGELLQKINPKLKVQNTPFMDLNTYYQMSDGLPVSVECTINFNSDIWLASVPCNHCPKSYKNEDLRNNKKPSHIVLNWKENSDLSSENLKLLTPFLKKMKKYIKNLDGEISIDINSTFDESFFSEFL